MWVSDARLKCVGTPPTLFTVGSVSLIIGIGFIAGTRMKKKNRNDALDALTGGPRDETHYENRNFPNLPRENGPFFQHVER